MVVVGMVVVTPIAELAVSEVVEVVRTCRWETQQQRSLRLFGLAAGRVRSPSPREMLTSVVQARWLSLSAALALGRAPISLLRPAPVDAVLETAVVAAPAIVVALIAR